jgi:hypothetical protein
MHVLCQHIKLETSYSEKNIRLFIIDAISCVTSGVLKLKCSIQIHRWIFWLIIRCKLQNIYRFINVKAGRPILPGIGTNSLGSKFRTGTNCLGNFGCPEHLATGPSSLIHRTDVGKFSNLRKLDAPGFPAKTIDLL